MATCTQCIGSKKTPNTVPAAYCDICGFGFRMVDGQFSNITCRKPSSVEEVSTKAISKIVSETKPSVEKEESSAEEKPPTVAIETVGEESKILEAIRTNGPAGKSKILEVAGLSEENWPILIKGLLAKKLISQEGERRGAKYSIL